MSGYSTSYQGAITVAALERFLKNLPGDMLIQVPSINRCPGRLINADHIFVDPKDNTVALYGDIAEALCPN